MAIRLTGPCISRRAIKLKESRERLIAYAASEVSEIQALLRVKKSVHSLKSGLDPVQFARMRAREESYVEVSRMGVSCWLCVTQSDTGGCLELFGSCVYRHADALCLALKPRSQSQSGGSSRGGSKCKAMVSESEGPVLKIRSLTMENYRRFRGRNTIRFATEPHAGLTLILGGNGLGKTMICNAIAWCLIGAESLVDAFYSEVSELNQDASVELEVEFGHWHFTLRREQKEGRQNSVVTMSIPFVGHSTSEGFRILRDAIPSESDLGDMVFDQSRFSSFLRNGRRLFIRRPLRPMILDAPFGPLDLAAADHVAHLLPRLRPQVVILMAPGVQSQRLEAQLKSRIGARYILRPSNGAIAIQSF